MILIIRLSFFLAVICFAVGLGGAFQGYVRGQLVLQLTALGVGLTAIAFLFSVIISILRPATNKKSKEFEMPVTAVLSLVMGLALLGVGAYGYLQFGDKPMIADISTDTDSPPKFRGPVKTVAALEGLEFMGNASLNRGYNPMDGMEQLTAYPAVKPTLFEQAREVVYQAALVSAKTSPGWRIVFEDATSYHFEAEFESEMFHFIDDIVVEIRSTKDLKSQLQVRSRSRYGIFDLGENANRIARYLMKVKQKVPEMQKRMQTLQDKSLTGAEPAEENAEESANGVPAANADSATNTTAPAENVTSPANAAPAKPAAP